MKSITYTRDGKQHKGKLNKLTFAQIEELLHELGIDEIYIKNCVVNVKIKKMDKLHIMYTYKGKFHESFKMWSFDRADKVLTRLGASCWQLLISDNIKIEKINEIPSKKTIR